MVRQSLEAIVNYCPLKATENHPLEIAPLSAGPSNPGTGIWNTDVGRNKDRTLQKQQIAVVCL